MRVLITGSGGELGTSIARRLEADPTIEAVHGIDVDPPRRRLLRASFSRIDPLDRGRMVADIVEFAPTAVVHLGVYEPSARALPATAHRWSLAVTDSLVAALADTGTATRVVLRSGIEVYGRGPGRPMVPGESERPAPDSAFGRTLVEVEGRFEALVSRSCSVTALRFAPIVGPSATSPLARYLRLPVVGVGGVFDAPFSLVHPDDVTSAFAAALGVEHPDAPNVVAVNVVGEGATTPLQAALVGRRILVPVLGPSWLWAPFVANLAGAPLPDHVVELLRRGRSADGSLARRVLGFEPSRTTMEVIRSLYEWDHVTFLDVEHEAFS